jgi:hypothetical protein
MHGDARRLVDDEHEPVAMQEAGQEIECGHNDVNSKIRRIRPPPAFPSPTIC